MLYYFDTSALVKLYHKERGSDKVKMLFEDNTAANCICQLTFTEFCSSLYKKFRSKEIADERVVQEAIKSFEIDAQFEWTIQIDQNVFDEARTIITKYGTQYAIRTLDALQLACAELISRSKERSLSVQTKSKIQWHMKWALMLLIPLLQVKSLNCKQKLSIPSGTTPQYLIITA